MTQPSFEPVFA